MDFIRDFYTEYEYTIKSIIVNTLVIMSIIMCIMFCLYLAGKVPSNTSESMKYVNGSFGLIMSLGLLSGTWTVRSIHYDNYD